MKAYGVRRKAGRGNGQGIGGRLHGAESIFSLVLHKSMARRIKHIRVSPLAVAQSKDKKRVILDLSHGKGGPHGDVQGLTVTRISMVHPRAK